MSLFNRNEQPTDSTVKAVIKKIRWQNGTRIIAEGQTSDGRKISMIGNMAEPMLNQTYEFNGNWKKDEKYGTWTMNFFSFRSIIPNDNAGIYHYLVRVGSWVGPETANKLIEAFGSETLNIIKSTPERVIAHKIAGLTPDRTNQLSESLRRNEKIEAAMVELGQFMGGHLGMGAVQKAIDRWGCSAAGIVKRAPHKLIELPGIGFIKADTVFLKMGGDANCLRRHVCALQYVLDMHAQQTGHTRAPLEQIVNDCRTVLKCELQPKAVKAAERAMIVKVEGAWISLVSLMQAENYIARRCLEIARTKMAPLKMSDALKASTETLEPEQLEAFNAAATEPLVIMTGAPGTGKTYTIARIVQLFQENHLTVKLAAPTGKAAKQMQTALSGVISSTTSMPKTIHSLLRPCTTTDGQFVFAHNEDDPISCQAIIFDESSMTDVKLFYAALRAVPANCRVVIVGDEYQLPSVGPGAVLRDLIASKLFKAVELKTIKRNAGLIVRACHMIKDGHTPQPAAKLDIANGDNWRHVETNSPAETIEMVQALLGTAIRSKGFDPMWQTQIISPTNERGPLSCSALNTAAKNVLNPGKPIEGLECGIGDKVIQTKNCELESAMSGTCPMCFGDKPDVDECETCDRTGIIVDGKKIRVVNGDIGVINETNDRHLITKLLWPSREVKVSKKACDLKLAFSVTCHKMQGSECPVIVMPIDRTFCQMPMVNREWIYTAFSRAKAMIITIGNLDALPGIISQTGRTRRLTSLVLRLSEYDQQIKSTEPEDDL